MFGASKVGGGDRVVTLGGCGKRYERFGTGLWLGRPTVAGL